MAQMRILVLLDSPETASGIAVRLRTLGHQARVCHDAGRAMMLCRSQPFDLLIQGMRFGDEAALGVVLTAQHHNPCLATILLSPVEVFPGGDLFAMLASLRCVMNLPPVMEDLIEVSSHLLREIRVRRLEKKRAGQGQKAVATRSGPQVDGALRKSA